MRPLPPSLGLALSPSLAQESGARSAAISSACDEMRREKKKKHYASDRRLQASRWTR